MRGVREKGVGLLEEGRDRGILSALDVQFAARLARLYGEQAVEVIWALAIACRQESRGHVCADLPRLEVTGLTAEIEGEVRHSSALPGDATLESWLDLLRGSAMIGTPESLSEGSGDLPSAAVEPTPLILDDRGRLYLRRGFMDQLALAEAIRERVSRPDRSVDWERAEAGIAALVPDAGATASGEDPRLLALRVGLARPLSVVTGGPGTGKTTLVARLIALVLEDHLAQGDPLPRIRLLAPTGKAAAAMAASFVRQRDGLEVAAEVRAALPTAAETIHRALLGKTRRDALGRRRIAPLEADVVVVDEASMVDLSTMRQLFSASREADRLLLVGDPDQLASVDAGAVLTELCAARPEDPEPDALATSIVRLEESHRFASGGAIARLAAAIREGDAEAALALLEDPEEPDVELCEVDSVAATRARLVEAAREIQRDVEAASSPDAKLDRLSSRRVLCAHRRGPLGVEALCEVLDEAAARVRQTTSHSGWWAGRLLLVTRNSPEQDLWNGDVGLVEGTDRGLRAFFADGQGGVRSLPAGRLPAFESAIAMSVHKSQGSEYDVVDLVLGSKASRLMTRELVYTGVTRARRQIRIHANAEVIREALSHRVERDSGLSELLGASPRG